MISLLITLVIYALIFYCVWWAIGMIALPEPFNKVVTVILVLVALLVIIGVLTGSVAPFALGSGLR